MNQADMEKADLEQTDMQADMDSFQEQAVKFLLLEIIQVIQIDMEQANMNQAGMEKADLEQTAMNYGDS